MREHGCSEEKAREICKERIRTECANYVRVVKDTRTRTDLSEDVKRYIEVMQYTLSGNVAWSTQCPRYNAGAKWNELQLLRAKYGVEKFPARWPPKDATDDHLTEHGYKQPHMNGHTKSNPLKEGNSKTNGEGMYYSNGVGISNGVNGHDVGNHESSKVNGHKRKRESNSTDEDIRMNGTTGVKKSAYSSRSRTDPLVLEDVVSLALDSNIPDLGDDVS